MRRGLGFHLAEKQGAEHGGSSPRLCEPPTPETSVCIPSTGNADTEGNELQESEVRNGAKGL